MKINRKQTMGVTLLGIAIACLGVDRIFFGPETAAADSRIPTPLSVNVDTAVTNTSHSGLKAAPIASRSPAGIAGIEISERLNAWAKLHPAQFSDLADAFVPSQRWTAAAQSGVASRDNQFDANFQQKYHLKAILLDPRGGRVLINDRVLSVGQMIGGMTLTDLDRKAAHFTGFGRETRLTLEPVVAVAEAE